MLRPVTGIAHRALRCPVSSPSYWTKVEVVGPRRGVRSRLDAGLDFGSPEWRHGRGGCAEAAGQRAAGP